MSELQVINPARYSEAEGEFLIEHLGEPPVVAMRAVGHGVNPKAVQPLIQRVYELNQLQEHENQPWVGTEALKEAFALYLGYMRKWRSDRRKGAPRFPSLFTYSAKGRPQWAAPGADGGIVKTYFDEKGQRKSFEIELVPDGIPEWRPEWSAADEPAQGSRVVVNHELNRWECFCGHTETFRPDNRSSYSLAKTRMSKHMRNAKDQVEEHRDAYAMEWGQ